MRCLLTICTILTLCGIAQAQMIFGVDMDNQEIVYLNSQSGTEAARFAVPGTSTSADDDIGLAGSTAGELYFCNGDGAEGTVYILDTADGSQIGTITLTDGDGWNVNGLGYESNGAEHFFSSGCEVGDLHRYYQLAPGVFSPSFGWTTVSVDNAIGSDDHGRVFAVQTSSGDIIEVNPSAAGAPIDTIGVTLDGAVVGLAYDGTNLYASTTAGMLYTIDPDAETVLNTVDLGYTLDALAAATGGPALEVEIDIKPGSYPSSINLKKKGVTPVAIHTTQDPAFDAANVDPTTILFNGLVAPVKWKIYDCDEIPNPLADPLNPDYDPTAPEMIGDGDDDLVLYFNTQELKDTGALAPGDTEATLTGELYDGTPITGTGDVSIVVQGKP